MEIKYINQMTAKWKHRCVYIIYIIIIFQKHFNQLIALKILINKNNEKIGVHIKHNGN